MSESKVMIQTNAFQTDITKELLEQYPDEVQEQFLDFIATVPLIKWMIGERPRAKDLPRDEKGRIKVDITKPHVLEDMDYFRPAALYYKENGCYTFLQPNSNPNSEYGQWFTEEVRRCREGYVREADGEWVTGLCYFYLNYSPIMLNRLAQDDIYVRVEDFPDFWEGIYYRYHYLEQARMSSKHCLELARRGCSKSFSLASIMSHNLLLGENAVAKQRITTILAAYSKEYLSDKDGTLSKFSPMIDFCANNTEFPRLMLKRSPSSMVWKMGYKNNIGNEKGSLNTVMGISIKDDESKIRGKRGYILYEEIGSFPTFKETWNNTRDSVKEGNRVFSLLYGVGTAGDNESDFAGIRTMLYNPSAFEIYALPNVYDQTGKGAEYFVYFFPSYISRAGCMDANGNSDVVKALLEILQERWITKQAGDAKTLLSRIAQMPITPSEAIMKVKSNFFPVVELNERLKQLDLDQHAYDDVYVGTLIEVNGKVEFRATEDTPIRQWRVDNSEQGALEIYEMPQAGKLPDNRYIIGHDPVDNDQAESASLSSSIVFDLFTDRIVAEWTGRSMYADDNFEHLRLLALLYNASIMVEANKKGCYAYFAKKHSTWMLGDCPDYLRERQLVKYSNFGSAQKGISVNAPINNFATSLIKDWLSKKYLIDTVDENGAATQQSIPMLYSLRGRALIEELIGYGPNVNTDRISALAQVMLYREHFIILYGGSPSNGETEVMTAADDEFFNRDWNKVKEKYSSLF